MIKKTMKFICRLSCQGLPCLFLLLPQPQPVAAPHHAPGYDIVKAGEGGVLQPGPQPPPRLQPAQDPHAEHGQAGHRVPGHGVEQSRVYSSQPQIPLYFYWIGIVGNIYKCKRKLLEHYMKAVECLKGSL